MRSKHAHLVVCLDNAHGIDDPNREDLIYFVNRHFVAEMPRFEGEEYQNVFQEDGSTAFTDEYKRKAVEVVRIPAGTKHSRLEDFLLGKHTSHKHPHHDEPFSRLAAWF